MTTEEMIERAKTTYCANVETEWLLWQLALHLESALKDLKDKEIRENL